jgi:hypothetical protein
MLHRFVLLLAAFVVCSGVVAGEPAATGPELDRLIPDSGAPGDRLWIKGSNLKPAEGEEVAVLFDSDLLDPPAEAEIKCAGAWYICATVPDVAPGVYQVTVQVGAEIAGPAEFEVVAPGTPEIRKIFPDSGSVGDPVHILGKNFAAPEGEELVVAFGEAVVPAENVTVKRPHHIEVVVPEIVVPEDPGSLEVLVTVSVGDKVSNAVPFLVTLPGVPVIEELRPDHGLAGRRVTIHGENLGGFGAEVEVLFGAADEGKTTGTSWGRKVYTRVPDIPPGEVMVLVVVNGVASNELPFTVDDVPAPVVEKVRPESGPVGSMIHIYGRYFRGAGSCFRLWDWGFRWKNGEEPPERPQPTVTIGGQPAEIKYFSSFWIAAVVPQLDPGSYPVVVDVDGRTSNDDVVFEVVPQPEPIITELRPTVGPVGTRIKIMGENLGGWGAEVVVTFAGDPDPVPAEKVGIGWRREICAVVPAGAVTGAIAVTVNGMAAVPAEGVDLTFTVTEAPDPAIEEIHPPAAPVGARITIVGTNLGSSEVEPVVTFSQNGADVVATEVWAYTCTWFHCDSRSYVKVIVPEGLELGAATVTVTVGDTSTAPADFEVIEPPEEDGRRRRH